MAGMIHQPHLNSSSINLTPKSSILSDFTLDSAAFPLLTAPPSSGNVCTNPSSVTDVNGSKVAFPGSDPTCAGEIGSQIPKRSYLASLNRFASSSIASSIKLTYEAPKSVSDEPCALFSSANRIRLWNKGVDSDSFHPRFRNHETRCLLSNGEPEKPLIIHVGRLGVEKSLDFCKQVMDRIPEARIAFIGDGPYRAELESIFTGMPAVFTGMLSGEELSKAYASGDVFLMPSESETLGLVVLESMSSGVPVVGVRAGGIPDIITEAQEGKTGYLYTPGNLEDCLSKLIPLLRDSELRERIVKAAREDMEQYDWKAATKKIRNEQYNAAIWFWRRKKADLLRPFQWCFKKIFGPRDEVTYVK